MNTKNTGKKSLRSDLLLLGGFLAIGLILFACLKLTAKEGAVVQINVSGEIVHEFSLKEDLEFTIEGTNGGTNELRIENGEAYLVDASCPDHICIHMGRIHLNGESIICLPNEVVIAVSDPDGENGANEVDAVSGSPVGGSGDVNGGNP